MCPPSALQSLHSRRVLGDPRRIRSDLKRKLLGWCRNGRFVWKISENYLNKLGISMLSFIYQCYHWYINAVIDISWYIYIDILIYPNRNEWFLERNRGLVWELWEINKNHQTQNSMGIICRKCWIDGISAEYHKHQVFFIEGVEPLGGFPVQRWFWWVVCVNKCMVV